MARIITKCRICGESELTKLMSLGKQALTGVFPKDKLEKITVGEVDLVKCTSEIGCGLVQLSQSYDLAEMYGQNYGYRSGLNESMVRHLHHKVESILKLNILNKGDLIVDIGSNDATTLRRYPSEQYELVGIDPTGVKFANFYTGNIKLIPDFFSADLIRTRFGKKKAKVITSFSMFYDLEDPVTFAKEISDVLSDEGVWVFEQSYLPSMLLTNSFDTICHEHLEFYSLKQIIWIANKANLKVIDVEFNDVNGGSFSVTCSKTNSSNKPNDKKINDILNNEVALGIDKIETFESFKIRVENSKKQFMDFLERAKLDGKKVYGLGASTKGNVLLQYYGITDNLIAAIGEVNEDKYGAFTPGTLIPLIPESQVLALNPDYLVIFPWHFKSFFESLPSLKGRTLIFPLPNFEVVIV